MYACAVTTVLRTTQERHKPQKKSKRLLTHLAPHVHIKKIQRKSASTETQWRKISKILDIPASLRLPYYNLASLHPCSHAIIVQRW